MKKGDDNNDNTKENCIISSSHTIFSYCVLFCFAASVPFSFGWILDHTRN